MTNDTTNTAASGRASHDELAELWSLLLADLRQLLTTSKERKKAPAAELLGVVRKFLRDNRAVCPDDQAQKALEGLYRLYLRSVSEALTRNDAGRVPAALLAEARALLSWHGVGDIPAAAARGVAQQLLAADVPFKLH